MTIRSLKTLLFTVLCIGTGLCIAKERPWKAEVGFGSRNISPMVVVAGVSYKDIGLRFQGLGQHSGPNDYWCGARGTLYWKFFSSLPFNFDVGIGGGYEYAEAPNKMHQAINHANDGMIVYPYNFKENLDISLEIWTHLYGFYTQISVPAIQIREHDAPDILWGVGYTAQF